MKALFKFLMWTIAIVVVLVIAAVIIIPMVVDPNDYKDQIAAQVKEKTGRDLALTGDLDLKFYPWLGVSMGEASLGNAPGFGDKPMAAVDSAAVYVQVMPLLRKELRVDTIELNGMVLNLAKNKAGQSNWDDLGSKSGGGESQQEKKRSSPNPLAAFAIGGLDINNATISYSDASTGQSTTIKGLDVTSGIITEGKPVDLAVGFDVETTEPAAKGRLDFSTTAAVDMNAKTYSLEDLALKLALAAESVGAKSVNLTLDSQVSGDINAKTYQMSGLKLGLDVTGEAVGNKTVEADLGANISGNSGAGTVSIKDLSLNSGALKLTGVLDGSGLNSGKPKFTGNANLAKFNLRSVLKDWGVELDTADSKAMTSAALSFNIDATDSSFYARKLNMTLDDSKLTGNFGIADFASQALRFALVLNQIDLDLYLPPKSDKVDPATATAGAGAEIPVETLRGLNIDGSFKIGTLKASGLTMGDASIVVKAKNGDIKVNQKVGKIYGGSSNAVATVDARNKTPKMRLKQSLSGVNIGPLLKDLTGDDRLSGKGRFQADLSTAGVNDAALKKALNGNLSFKFEDGAVKGINIGKVLRETKAQLSGKPVTASGDDEKTEFTEMSASATIVNGVLQSNDLDAKSPLLRIGGEGKVDLVGESMDYTIVATIVDSIAGQGGEDLDKLKGVPIPVRAKGPFTNLAYSVDWEKVLTAKAKEELKGKARAKIDELISKDGGKNEAAGQLLKGFLGGGDSASDATAAEKPAAKTQQPKEKAEQKPEDLLKGLFR